MRSGNGSTSVYVENTLRQVYVNGTNVPQLNKITITPGQPPRIAPIAPQDRREIGRGLAFLGGNGSAAAAPEPGNEAGTTATNNLTASTNTLPSTSALNDLAVADLASPALPVTLPLAPTTATITGTFGGTRVDGAGFGFDIALSGGAISNGWVSGGNFIISFSLSGGTGQYTGGLGSVSGYSGSFVGSGWGWGVTSGPIGAGTELSFSLPDLNQGTQILSGDFLLRDSSSGSMFEPNIVSGQVDAIH
jgi:hypothetical protein